MASTSSPRAPAGDDDALIIARALRLEGFLPEFNAELCGKLFARSGVSVYEPGSFLIEQGEKGRDLFVLLEGRVTVTKNMGAAPRQVNELGPQAVLGEIALLRDGTRTASVVALMSTRAFRLVNEDLRYVLEHNPELAAHLEELVQQRSS